MEDRRFKRHSIRLPGYDYTLVGAYFVTIVTHNRHCIFGYIDKNETRLNRLGVLARDFWLNISEHFCNTIVEPFVIMPNHIHGIITILESRGTACRAPTAKTGFGHPIPGSIPTIIRSYKSSVSRQARIELGIKNIWQRNYYDHIVRNQSELDNISSYILANPLNWLTDPEYA